MDERLIKERMEKNNANARMLTKLMFSLLPVQILRQLRLGGGFHQEGHVRGDAGGDVLHAEGFQGSQGDVVAEGDGVHVFSDAPRGPLAVQAPADWPDAAAEHHDLVAQLLSHADGIEVVPKGAAAGEVKTWNFPSSRRTAKRRLRIPPSASV